MQKKESYKLSNTNIWFLFETKICVALCFDEFFFKCAMTVKVSTGALDLSLLNDAVR